MGLIRIENLLMKHDPELLRQFVEVVTNKIPEPRVQAHKDRLGRQTRCTTSYKRWWEWELDRGCEVCVSSEKLHFCIPSDMGPEEAVPVLQKYMALWD